MESPSSADSVIGSEMIPSWAGFIAKFSKWHQFRTDLLHWEKDLTHGNVTYLQSQFEGMSGEEISFAQWMKTEGVEWAIDIADTWLGHAMTAAEVLNAPDLEAYLAYRRAYAAAEHGSLQVAVQREAITDELVADFRRASDRPDV